VNWFLVQLIKEDRGRRFKANDKVRYFTDKLKGKGKGIVLTPSFLKGTVVDFDRNARRYKVRNHKDELVDVHPRNLIPDSFAHKSTNNTKVPIPSQELDITEDFGPILN